MSNDDRLTCPRPGTPTGPAVSSSYRPENGTEGRLRERALSLRGG